MKKEYTWEFVRDKEEWDHDVFESIEECVMDYQKNFKEDKAQDVIYVGECEHYTLHVDGRGIIEGLTEEAFDDCGECAEGWEPFVGKQERDWAELDRELTKVVVDWLVKHNDMPAFYNVSNIVEVKVE